MKYIEQREEVAYFMRRLYQQKLTTCSGGNISRRIDKRSIAITPSRLDKATLQTEQIGVITTDGKSQTPELKFSMETGMHLAIYNKRPDVKAIVHAHPTIATSFSVMNRSINTALTGEARFILGDPAIADYALMGTPELAAIVSEKILDSNVVITKNHGILTVGKTLLEAFDRIEVLESAAKMTLITDLLNDKNSLSEKQITEIDALL